MLYVYIKLNVRKERDENTSCWCLEPNFELWVEVGGEGK